MNIMDRLPANSYALIDEISDEFNCPVTKELLVDPYQSSCCGHFFSKEAYDRLLTQKAKCPMCRSISLRCTPDKAFRRHVHQALKVKCHLHNGCDWTGSFSDFLQHCGISINDASSTKSMSPIVTKNVKDFSMENFSTYLGDKTYFQSPTFYTHPKGYKMCIRVYPHGYDACESTHVCVVTYLMNGQYDDKLQFPFRGSVTVQVVNHNNEDENHERIFDFSDKTDDIICMRVPESEVMNSGLAMYNFIPLNELQNTKGIQYLKEDNLSFKVAKIVVKSSSSYEQLQHEDVKSSIVQESKEEPEWNSKTLPESGTNVTAERTTSNEESLKPQPGADGNEISRSQSGLNKPLSKESNSSVESSGSGESKAAKRRALKWNNASEDDAGSFRRTKSLQHSADDRSLQKTKQKKFKSNRTYSEGANNPLQSSRSGIQLKKHVSCDGSGGHLDGESGAVSEDALDEDDLIDVMDEVMDMASKWRQLGLALRLKPAQLDTISSTNHTDPTECLRDVLLSWLRKCYDTTKFGQPSWTLLCQAIHKPAGGNNPGLAGKIAGEKS